MNDSPPPLPESRSCPAPQPGPWNLWATLGFSLAIVIIYAAAATIVSVLYLLSGVVTPELAESDGLLFALSSLFAGTAAAAAVVFFAWLRRGITIADYLKFQRPRGRDLLIWPLLLLAMMAPMEWLRVKIFGEPAVPEVMLNMVRNCGLPVVLWLAVLVGAPVAEEIFFRGFLFEGIRCSFLGAAGAVILCAASWAAIHVQYGPTDMAAVFIGGIFLGIARLRSGSLWLPMFLHFIWNFIAMVQTVLSV